MTELIFAYDMLMDDDYGSTGVGDSRVALACEMYTIDELRLNRLYDVYTLQILYDDNNKEIRNSYDDTKVDYPTKEQDYYELTNIQTTQIFAHPDDSVLDLKRHLQESFAERWDLSERKSNRYQIATDWELVAGIDGSILGNHLFLHDYAIKNNDLIHAIVLQVQE